MRAAQRPFRLNGHTGAGSRVFVVGPDGTETAISVQDAAWFARRLRNAALEAARDLDELREVKALLGDPVGPGA